LVHVAFFDGGSMPLFGVTERNSFSG